MRPRIRRRILATLAAPIAVYGALELALWACGFAPPRYSASLAVGRYWVEHGEPGKPAGYVRAFPRAYSWHPEPIPLFAKEKPRNGLRIFVVGESSVQGLPYEIGSFSDWLRARLAAMLPERAVEVINAGNAGWRSVETRSLLEECLEHRPDAVVWMVGHNEFVPHNVLALRYEIEHPILSAARSFVLSLRTTRCVAGAIPMIALARDVVFDRREGDGRACYGAELPLLKQRFRETTEGAVADARRAGVPIVLLTNPRNAREWPPNYSILDERLRADPQARKRWNELCDRASSLLDRRPPLAEAALARLREALDLDGGSARVLFLTGRAHEILGRPADAKNAYHQAIERDACPSRAQDWVQSCIREAALRHCAPLVDLADEFDRAGALGIAGSEWLADNAHPNLEGHRRIADFVLTALEGTLALPLDRARDPSPAEVREKLGIADYERDFVDRAECKGAMRALLQAGAASPMWARIVERCRKCLERQPDDHDLRSTYGCLLALDPARAAEARAEIEAAIAASPGVKLGLLVSYRLEPPIRRRLEAAGVDMALVERTLNDLERITLANRLARAR